MYVLEGKAESKLRILAIEIAMGSSSEKLFIYFSHLSDNHYI